jgi:hypothetical protein
MGGVSDFRATIVVPANAGTQCRAGKKTQGSRVRGTDEIADEEPVAA